MSFRNLSQVLRHQAVRLGARPAIRYKRYGLYRDLSWMDYREQAVACAAALIDAGITPGERVGLLSENRVEWLPADMGLLTAGAVNVPPHAPLTAKQIHFQLEDAEARWLFVSNAEQLGKALQIAHQLPRLLGIASFDSLPATVQAAIPVLSWRAFLARGRAVLPRHAAEIARREELIGREDLATIMYTSGTTGNPKGVMLTHGNLLSNSESSLALQDSTPEDVILNWLPLSHIYARTVDHYQNLLGGRFVCLAESAETLVLNLAETQPTHLSSVPRFYEKVLTAVSNPDKAITAKRLKDIFGPRMRWIGSGGAPLPDGIAQAFQEAGLPIYQGYGLTESSPVISFNRPGHHKLGTVGQAIPGVEIRIGDDGEVLSRGSHIMKGYWKNPEATAESVRDGWLHTGDLGTIDADGFLKITGRKKELMVLSNGKKVVPNYLEGLLLADSCIDQAVVCGEGKNYLTALVVPHWDNVRSQLATVKLPASLEACAKDPAVISLMRRRVDEALRDVSSYEQIKKLVILPQPFTVAAEELTVSLKIRRKVIQQHYREAIEALYKD